MACPIASVTAIVATLGGARALLLEDHRYRFLAWGTLMVIVMGWAAYYMGVDAKPFRIVLEVLSTGALVAAVLRIRWLLRVQGLRSPMLSAIARFPKQAWRAIGSPWLIVAKMWLIAMIVMAWRGKANFSSLEYAIVSGVLVATIVGQYFITRRARPRFAGLEALSQGAAPVACPFDSGCDTSANPEGALQNAQDEPSLAAEAFALAPFKNARQA